MAAGHDTHNDVIDDFPAHEKSYSLFAGMMKWGTVASFIVAMVVVLIIA